MANHVVKNNSDTTCRDGEEAHQSQKLVPYDIGTGSRNLLLTGFITISFLSFCIIVGGAVWIYFTWRGFAAARRVAIGCALYYPFTANVISLVFTVLVALATETLGNIHSITLRWALASEGRLHYNSNLRLFTTTRNSISNGLASNVVWTSLLIICYGGAASACFDQGLPNDRAVFFVDAISAIALGIAVIGLCILTGIGWGAGERSGRIKSWNPHPLNTALACKHHNLFQLSEPFPDSSKTSEYPVRLLSRQPSVHKSITTIGYVTKFTCMAFIVFVVLACIILGVLFAVRGHLMTKNFTWSFLSSNSFAFTYMDIRTYEPAIKAASSSELSIDISEDLPHGLRPFIPLLWNCAWQAFSTITFHIQEILVNVRRDEACWRRASSAKGAKFEQNAFLGAISNKSSVALFVLKPLGQWLFSLGVFVVGFNPVPLFVLAATIGILALVAYLVAHHQPKGPQPATYGHIQTIIELTDDWGQGPEGKLWWGDKGYSGEINIRCLLRRMGTSGQRDGVGEIHENILYTVA